MQGFQLLITLGISWSLEASWGKKVGKKSGKSLHFAKNDPRVKRGVFLIQKAPGHILRLGALGNSALVGNQSLAAPDVPVLC